MAITLNELNELDEALIHQAALNGLLDETAGWDDIDPADVEAFVNMTQPQEPTPSNAKRLSDVLNTFCATGSGGGVDPSCSPSVSQGLKAFAGTVATGDKHIAERAYDKFEALLGGKVENTLKHVKRSLHDAGKKSDYGAVREAVYQRLDEVRTAMRGHMSGKSTDSKRALIEAMKDLATDLKWARKRANLR